MLSRTSRALLRASKCRSSNVKLVSISSSSIHSCTHLQNESKSSAKETKITSDHDGTGSQHYNCSEYYYNPASRGDCVFTVDAPSIRYGPGALREVGDAAANLKMKRVVLFTDPVVASFEIVDIVKKSLEAEGIECIVYDQVEVEPTCESFSAAAKFSADAKPDGYISVGGGSVMDTCKAANLIATYPPVVIKSEEDSSCKFLQYVNPPIGRGLEPKGPLKPHIACPTTSGTGSETTGLAIFDLLSMKAKTGIGSHKLRPSLAVVDPNVTSTMPAEVCAASGFDVLSHALESYTALPHTQRERPDFGEFSKRPMSQGANVWADIGCLEALRILGKNMIRAVHDADDTEAREQMMFASMLAGISFGNVGCHLPHGMSYPVSGNVRDFQPEGYPKKIPIIPHGMSVIVNAPSVFQYTSRACPERHIVAAEALGADIRGAHLDDAGNVLSERIVELMKATKCVPNGLTGVGYNADDIDMLVKGAAPQHRLIKNAPMKIVNEDLEKIYKGALQYW